MRANLTFNSQPATSAVRDKANKCREKSHEFNETDLGNSGP